jgi:hypothetical protein
VCRSCCSVPRTRTRKQNQAFHIPGSLQCVGLLLEISSNTPSSSVPCAGDVCCFVQDISRCCGRNVVLSQNPQLVPILKILSTPWPSVRKRTIPTERPPLVDEI